MQESKGNFGEGGKRSDDDESGQGSKRSCSTLRVLRIPEFRPVGIAYQAVQRHESILQEVL